MPFAHPLILGALKFTLLAAATQAPPTITSGQILTRSIDVTHPPASPRVMLHIQNTADSVMLVWTGPAAQTLQSWFVGGTWSGNTRFQGFNAATPGTGYQLAFNLYTQPGTWSLTALQICQHGQCSYYNQPHTKALLGNVSLTVANPNTYDITPPCVVGAELKTPSISLSEDPTLAIDLKATDDISGIHSVLVQAAKPGNFTTISVRSAGLSEIPLSKLFNLTGTLQPGTPTGTYQISTIFVQDYAGNVTSITEPARIAQIFGGQTEIKVRK